VLGNRGEPLRALPPIEIRPAAGRFFDYQQKYAADGAREVCPVESLDPATVERVQARARAFYDAAGCEGYARVDFIVPTDGEPVLLEANTLPGFTARSLLPQEAAVAGMDYRGLVLWVIEAALRRRGGRS
jgi:D-alanine-D-alanine ligase